MKKIRPALRLFSFRHKILRRPLVRMRYRGLKPEDALLAGYTRSGSTYLRFLTFEALTGESSEFGRVRRVVPGVGRHQEAIPVLPGGGRVIQTHETYCDRDRKVVFVIRDARSVLLSEYTWHKGRGMSMGTLDEFIDDFLTGKSNPWGRWDEHAKFWLESLPAKNDHLLLIKYEDLFADPEGEYRRVIDFLGVDVDAETLRKAVENNSLEKMREKEDRAREAGWRKRAVPGVRFVNKGGSRGWRERLTPEQVRKVEDEFGETLVRLGYEVTSKVG
jgi:hypothetical protein